MRIKKVLKVLIQIIIYAAVGYLIYDKLNGNLGSLAQYKVHSYPVLIVAVFLYSFNSVLNGINWHRLMELVGERLSLSGQMDVYLRSYLLRYIPGNVVGILSRGVFNKKYGVSTVTSLWGWFLENIIYLLWAIVFGSYIIIKNITQLLPQIDFSDRVQVVTVSVLAFLILSCVAIALVSLIKLDVLEKIFRRFLLPQLPIRNRSGYKKIAITKWGRLEIFLRYGISWLIPSVCFLLVVYGLIGLPIDRPFELISANALAYALGYIVIVTPSGGGVREAVLIYALSTINGFSPSDSVIIAIATRVVYIFGELLTLAMFYPLLIGRGMSKNRNGK
jgi:hypothetical protein